ncbi:hypothetical protein NA56DRAFT_645718 [Hyaloscypha hepaticicola]|uniref:DUF7580 domain-containing protein n=1 Tax=Hyaloscypha hepaticicola TaxID=2082293 RepID=A0A2J6Q591_9HELO|nr:hypothetical protein NA56DRAFT_645718 [Hyaloscypha hepaticicola]
MEIAGFIFGLSGLIAVADKALCIAQLISEVQHFGEDTTEILFQLANESQKIHSLIVHIAEHHDRGKAEDADSETDEDENDSLQLVGQVRMRLNSAFSRLQIAINEAEGILEKYGLLSWGPVGNDTTASAGPQERRHSHQAGQEAMLGLKLTEGSAGLGLSSVLEHRTRTAAVEHRVSLKKRVKFLVKPWSTSDKARLLDAISRMKYWNAEVRSMLSGRERRQIQEHASCQIMAATDNAAALAVVQSRSDGENPELQASAALSRKRIEAEEDAEAILVPSVHMSPAFKDWNCCKFEVTQVGHHDLAQIEEVSERNLGAEVARATALIDWVDYSKLTLEQKDLMLSRVERLCQLLEFANKPQKLRTLSCLGYLEDVVRNRYGLLLRVPDSGSSSVISISLSQIFDMASAKKKDRLVQNLRPNLLDRYRLARHLAQTFMELHKVRWFHKGFDSRKILFFCSKSPADPLPSVSFGESYIWGFEFSRPWGKENRSLPVNVSPGFDIYSHPDLREVSLSVTGTSPESTVPRFKAAYDIYSLSATLLEIGLWQPLKALVPTRPESSRDLQALLVRIAEQNLAHTMGVNYRDAVVNGLRWAEDSGPHNGYTGQSTDEAEVTMVDIQRMFWDVVRPLEQCACGVYS